jgi:hypothetical protein
MLPELGRRNGGTKARAAGGAKCRRGYACTREVEGGGVPEGGGPVRSRRVWQVAMASSAEEWRQDNRAR